jgi:hypothetical protein
LTQVDSSEIPNQGVKPSFWAYLRAAIRLIETGKAPTQVNLAKELRVSKQAVWKFQRRYPDLMPWIDEQLRAVNQNYFGLVQRRLALLAMQGSVAHAEAYFKSVHGVYAREENQVSDARAGNGYTINLLVPRPELPVIPGVAMREAAHTEAAAAPTRICLPDERAPQDTGTATAPVRAVPTTSIPVITLR